MSLTAVHPSIPDLQPHCEGPEILSLELLDLRIYIRPHLHSTAVSQALSACLTTSMLRGLLGTDFDVGQ